MDSTVPSVGLDDLIAAVTSAHESALDRLEGGPSCSPSHLDEVADRLDRHFSPRPAGQALRGPRSVPSMGVTKQAVQKRFFDEAEDHSLDPSQGFSSFTDPARAAVVSAQARAAGHDRITVGHLVLGLISDPDCGAATSMTAQGMDLALIARTARATLPSPAEEVPAFIPFDQHARAALERAFGVAERLGHERVGTEHLVLAILEVEDGTGVLAGLGLDPRRVEGGHRRAAAVIPQV